MIDVVEAEFERSIKAVAETYDADIYLYSGTIDHAGFGKVVEAFAPGGRTNALLILTTNGGLPTPPIRSRGSFNANMSASLSSFRVCARVLELSSRSEDINC